MRENLLTSGTPEQRVDSDVKRGDRPGQKRKLGGRDLGKKHHQPEELGDGY